VAKNELSEEYITPSMFDARVVPTVAAAVAEAAIKTGVARKQRRWSSQARRAGVSRTASTPSPEPSRPPPAVVAMFLIGEIRYVVPQLGRPCAGPEQQ